MDILLSRLKVSTWATRIKKRESTPKKLNHLLQPLVKKFYLLQQMMWKFLQKQLKAHPKSCKIKKKLIINSQLLPLELRVMSLFRFLLPVPKLQLNQTLQPKLNLKAVLMLKHYNLLQNKAKNTPQNQQKIAISQRIKKVPQVFHHNPIKSQISLSLQKSILYLSRKKPLF